MLNTKRSFNNNVYNASKSRNKSIYRGDQSHTLSMHIRIDNQVSPDKSKLGPELQLQHKYSHKENKIQAFRQSLKISESGNYGKKTSRDEMDARSSKRLVTNVVETDRSFKLSVNASHRKQQRTQKSFVLGERIQNGGNLQNPDTEQVAINYQQLKAMLMGVKKLTNENAMLKKQLSVLRKNKPSSSIIKALAQY